MKKIIAIISVILIAIMLTACNIKTFQSSAVVKIKDTKGLGIIIDTGTYTNLLESNTAITNISESLDFEISNNELKKSIVIQEIDMNGTFEITVSHTDKEISQKILNALLKESPLILKNYSSDLNFVVISKSTDGESE